MTHPGIPPALPPGPPGDQDEQFSPIESLHADGELRADLFNWMYSALKEAVTSLGSTEITVVIGAFHVGGRNLGMRAVLTTDPGHADPESLTERVVNYIAGTFPGQGFQGQVQLALTPKGKKNPICDPWSALLSIGQKALPDPNGGMGVGWGQPPAHWHAPQQPQQPSWGPPSMGAPSQPMPQHMPQQVQQIHPNTIVQGPDGRPMYYWQMQQLLLQAQQRFGGMPVPGGGGGFGGPPNGGGPPGVPEDDGEPFDFGGGGMDDGLGAERQDWTTAMLGHQQQMASHRESMRATELNAGLSEREMTWDMLRWFADRMAKQSERAMIMATEAMKTARSTRGGGGGGDDEPDTRWSKVKQLAEIGVEAAAGTVMDRLGFEDDDDTSTQAPAIKSAPKTRSLRAPRKEVPDFTPPERRVIEERVYRNDEVSGSQEYEESDEPEPD